MSNKSNSVATGNVTALTSGSLTGIASNGSGWTTLGPSGIPSAANCMHSSSVTYGGTAIGYYPSPSYSSANIEIRIVDNGFLVTVAGKQLVATDKKDLNSVINEYLKSIEVKAKK